MRQEISEAEQKRAELLEEQKKLEAEKEKWQDPKEIEQKAREKLGMVKDGEVPYLK
jgi:cell division protein DivIC